MTEGSLLLRRDLRRQEHLWLGLGVGFYVSRILAEQGAAPRPWPAVLCLALVCVALAAMLLAWARRSGCRLAPLALCYGYAFYPRTWPPLALGVGLAALIGLAIANTQFRQAKVPGGVVSDRKEPFRLLRPSQIVHCAVFLGGLALYGRTLAPTVLPADAGEFQLVAALLGVAHPPGYPLYTLLGKLFTFIPLGDVAYRVNLLSAVIGALTLALVSWAVRQVSLSAWPGLAAALALGSATTFWAQATTASIRGLTALFTVLILGLTLACGRAQGHRRRSQRYLVALGFAFGLAISHHGSLGFLALPVGVYLIRTDRALIRRPQKLLEPLAAAMLGLSVLLYLPLRDALGAPLAPGDLTTIRGFFEHVMAQGFRDDMFAFAQPELVPDRLYVLKDILLMQFGGPLLLVMLTSGGLLMWRGSRRDALLLWGALLLNGFVALTYRAPQTVEYLMPAYVSLALLLGGGLGVLAALPGPRTAPGFLALPAALVIALGVAQAAARYPSFRLLHSDRSARTYAEGVLQAAPPQAVILANWHHTTSLRYLQMVEGQRPDVTIRYVHPRGSTPLPDLWREEIDRHLPRRPDGMGAVIVTNVFPEFEAAPFRLDPLGGAFLVVGQGDEGDMRGVGVQGRAYTPLHVAVGHALELVGYDLRERTISPHQPLELFLAWRPVAPLEADFSFFVHLVGTDGVPVAQADTRHAAGRHELGEVLVDRHFLVLRPTVPPGTYALIVGAYLPLEDGGWERLATPDGADHVVLTHVEVLPSSQMPATLHPCHQRFASGVTLVGVDYDTSYPDSQRVYLHWQIGELAPATQALLSSAGPLCSSDLPRGSRSRSTYLSTACDIPSEISSLHVELHRASDGQLLPGLGPWHFDRGGQYTLSPPEPGSRYLSLGGEMALVGVHVAPGAQVSVRLDWLSLRALTRDYTVSLRLCDSQDRWQAQDDGTPGQGAIPTLKWIRGTRVADVRSVTPPVGAELSRARLELLVYEAFTLAPLPPLDERLLAQGTAVSLGVVEMTAPP